MVTYGLTACTPGSAPGPTFGNEYGRTLHFLIKITSLVQEITYHMGSHSVTCHPAVVTFMPLPQPKLILDLSTSEGYKTELTKVVVTTYPKMYLLRAYVSHCR